MRSIYRMRSVLLGLANTTVLGWAGSSRNRIRLVNDDPSGPLHRAGRTVPSGDWGGTFAARPGPHQLFDEHLFLLGDHDFFLHV